MASPGYPSLYQINTRVTLTELSRSLGHPATLDDFPDAELDRLAAMGFDWMRVWHLAAARSRISRSNQEWRREFERTLPDLQEEDIAGSGFRSPATPCSGWAVRRRSPDCARGCGSAGSG